MAPHARVTGHCELERAKWALELILDRVVIYLYDLSRIVSPASFTVEK